MNNPKKYVTARVTYFFVPTCKSTWLFPIGRSSHILLMFGKTRKQSFEVLARVSYRAYKVGEHIPLCKRTMLVLCVTPTPRSVGSVSPKLILAQSVVKPKMAKTRLGQKKFEKNKKTL